MGFSLSPEGNTDGPDVVAFRARTTPKGKRILRGVVLYLNARMVAAYKHPIRLHYGDAICAYHIAVHLLRNEMFCRGCPDWYRARMGAKDGL